MDLITFVLHFDRYLLILLHQYDSWIYAIAFVVMLCQTGLAFIPFLPGDSLILALFSIAASVSTLNPWYLFVLLTIAAVLGDFINYGIGKYLGKVLFAYSHSKIFKQSYLHLAQYFYQRHGGKTIVLARFIPIIRSFAPFVAGMGKMPISRFSTYNILGAFLWITLFGLTGYFLGQVPLIKHHLSVLLLFIIILSLLPIGITYFTKKSNDETN